MTPHLGSWISALADGQLDASQTEEALEHVAVCRACARELDDARRSRRLLASATDDVRPDPALTARLIALQASIPGTDDDPLRSPRRPTWGATPLPGLVDGVRLSGHVPTGRRRTARFLALGAGSVGALGLVLFGLGQSPQVTPGVSAADAMTMLARTGPDERAAGTDVLAGLAPAGAIPEQRSAAALGWVGSEGWAAPSDLPEGLEVTAVRLVGDEGQILEIDLSGESGHAVVREQLGRLAGDGSVQVLSRTPAHLAWQSDDVVVDVVADLPEDMLAELVASFPARDYDAGVLSRIARGWSTATGAISSP
ncbi:anti-sigma factor family protein [Myceligenerans pegani]|uniref:Zf-HC2 domain-containing protein n=1 Tax=Myceligenerans pegani TaxID=2776917 RepID=A0ABR9N1C8_9MICO|nr:zf-HC2 domain-containing protein [Myceligenerans sp. TRM 65318]MBE1877091.1 zf-HC2 domain-containing protein [Myceligenerans sp. TRM 65318]MBE3019362.1 zf-HC2 domain-containing protein [Myceligenerans sp. TRM 65318]